MQELGILYRLRGQWDQAIDLFEASIALFQDMGDRRWEACTRRGLADVYYEQGRFEEALVALNAVLPVFRDLGTTASKRSPSPASAPSASARVALTTPLQPSTRPYPSSVTSTTISAWPRPFAPAPAAAQPPASALRPSRTSKPPSASSRIWSGMTTPAPYKPSLRALIHLSRLILPSSLAGGIGIPSARRGSR